MKSTMFQKSFEYIRVDSYKFIFGTLFISIRNICRILSVKIVFSNLPIWFHLSNELTSNLNRKGFKANRSVSGERARAVLGIVDVV